MGVLLLDSIETGLRDFGSRDSWRQTIVDGVNGGVFMASIIVRGLAESVKRRLAVQAQEHGRSLEAEVREILTSAVTRPHIGLALAQAAREVGGLDELQIPERTDPARTVDFG